MCASGGGGEGRDKQRGLTGMGEEKRNTRFAQDSRILSRLAQFLLEASVSSLESKLASFHSL